MAWEPRKVWKPLSGSIQETVYNAMESGRPYTIDELVALTDLKYDQIYRALQWMDMLKTVPKSTTYTRQ